MRKNTGLGFTLVEILAVVIIIAVLTGLALPGFSKVRQSALDKEAKISLRFIQAAQSNYFVRTDKYYPDVPPADVSSINSGLGLKLSNANWDYAVVAADAASFSATASRAGAAYTWGITQADSDAIKQ